MLVASGVKRKIRTKKSVQRGRSLAAVKAIRGHRTGYTGDMVPLVEPTAKRGLIDDPFQSIDIGRDNGELRLIEPPYPYNLLVQAGRSNSALNQAVEAYVVNIESYGYQLEYIGPAGKENKPIYQQEKNRALVFLDNPNGDKTLRKIREDRRRDLEYTGNCYIEVGRDNLGRPAFIEHVPSIKVRKTTKDEKATEYQVAVRTPDGKIAYRTWAKKFCRYVQAGKNGQRVFFKEFGDPRPIDPKTGKVNPSLSIEEQATELYCDELYSPGVDYGIPRWIGALPDMLGLRESEIVNLNFFRENAIPAMAVLISGGALTEESFDKVTNVINAARGIDSMHRIMILEAASDDSMGDIGSNAPPAPKIELKPLTDRQSDGLFKDYQDAGKKKIRSTMRLPAIYSGDSEEYTKATAQAGLRVAETQIFAPERSRFDDFVNKYVLPALGIANWKYRSLGPTVYDPETLSLMVDRFGRQGAMTPNILIKIANQVLDVQIPPVTDKWGDVPFGYTLDILKQGKQVDGFEEAFVELSDASLGNTGDETQLDPTNDNGEAAIKRLISNSLTQFTDDVLSQIRDAQLENSLAA